MGRGPVVGDVRRSGGLCAIPRLVDARSRISPWVSTKGSRSASRIRSPSVFSQELYQLEQRVGDSPASYSQSLGGVTA